MLVTKFGIVGRLQGINGRTQALDIKAGETVETVFKNRVKWLTATRHVRIVVTLSMEGERLYSVISLEPGSTYRSDGFASSAALSHCAQVQYLNKTLRSITQPNEPGVFRVAQAGVIPNAKIAFSALNESQEDEEEYVDPVADWLSVAPESDNHFGDFS